MTDTDEKTVYIPSSTTGRKRRYHTDPTCHRLKLARGVSEKPLKAVEPTFEECTICSGEYRPGCEEYTQSTREKLLKMDSDEIGGNDGGTE